MTESLIDISWPPQYRIKKHGLAKHVKLKTVENHCLEITVPVRLNLKKIPDILEENKIWIMKHLSVARSKKSDTLPERISLMALNQIWSVQYLECQAKFEMIIRPTQEIVFVGKKEDNQIYRNKLITFIKNKSRTHLANELENLSQKTKLPFDSLSIRNQKTLWGSCTVQKAISLNYKLIFLPERLLQHVIIHELCHTLYLDHSERFWNKVEEFDPAFREHRRELRKADQYIPEWL
jgi:predicted metal-dependent hydrolase